jgi:hypothetical protein
MPATFVQEASFYNSTSSAVINLAYANPNAAGALGVAWLFTGSGTPPSSISDSNGNTWCPIPAEVITNLNGMNGFVCAHLAAGANTVTANSSLTRVTSMIILEYAYTGPAQWFAMQPTAFPGVYAVPTTAIANVISIHAGAPATYFMTVIGAIYDLSGNTHDWSLLPVAGFPGAVRGFVDESATGFTSAAGDVTVANTGYLWQPFGLDFFDPNINTNGLSYNILAVPAIAVVTST